ncbi:bifunctional alpha,alpha-trehalose-phosphate synthase (UDP-forming)/trehalose-phosphatase [Brevibacterium daeguense]|uniref:Bifunctional alpha,alpha-trehalose-phosphate synthase (UDP-forming)/trehalose-phosphatase n=1 Tax=Brevibacterium daeguense TaxID=909936 RepID=A0ABP8EGM7_9MICO
MTAAAADKEPNQNPVRPPSGGADFVVVANRLPVDRDTSGDTPQWTTSPGGLVTALAPVMRENSGAWIGWAGVPDEEIAPFDVDGMHLVPVTLSAQEIINYYEGFSNATLWPLYHDVIVPPEFHRAWWESYVHVNRRFAQAVALEAAAGATVWIHDYQLQLVPALVRALRPDVSIGFFNHIPFPSVELFAQLPWRAQILTGLLGADLIGFQRPADAANFRRAARALLSVTSRGNRISVPADSEAGTEAHVAEARAFPISVDTSALDAQAREPEIIARAAEIREELGDPELLLLGVDRMDYTKGIRHRLKAFGELLADGLLDPEKVTLVQIATPSRERIDQYQQIRSDVELSVGRINGEFSEVGIQPIHYFHHSYPREEMTALYRAADVLLVTALRDGMNLVAKEYVACRPQEDGALVLSEFAGAADQLTQAVLVNPHNIDGLKAEIVRAVAMDPREQRRRMRSMRRRLFREDVQAWSQSFLSELEALDADKDRTSAITADSVPARAIPVSAPAEVDLTPLVQADRLLVALDFDGVIAPLQDDPSTSAPLPESAAAVEALAALPDTVTGYISGRNVSVLKQLSTAPGRAVFVGSHGVEVDFSGLDLTGAENGTTDPAVDDSDPFRYSAAPTEVEQQRLEALDLAFERILDATPAEGHGELRLERKPLGRTFHTRGCSPNRVEFYTEELHRLAAEIEGLRMIVGHAMIEFGVRMDTKGNGLDNMIDRVEATAALYIGDDTTDEDAFIHLHARQSAGLTGLSIKVGPGDTAAEVRLDSPEAVAEVLARLAAERAAHHGLE